MKSLLHVLGHSEIRIWKFKEELLLSGRRETHSLYDASTLVNDGFEGESRIHAIDVSVNKTII